MNDGNKKSIINFGLHGWITIFYCFMMFWLYAGMVNSGSNAIAPALAKNFNVSPGDILKGNTVAGIFAIIFFIGVGQLNKKYGPVKTSGIALIFGGIAYYFVGNAINLTTYTIAMCVVAGTLMSSGYVCGGELTTQWFPKKKGIVMGYTTMGHNMASVAFVPLIIYLVSTYGVNKGVVPISVVCVLVGIFGILAIKGTPQERGQNPDNVSDEIYESEYFHGQLDNSHIWTIKKLLSVKETWLAALSTGLFQTCTLGVVSQMVIRNMELGFSKEKAVLALSIVALIGLIGSFFVGVIDEKIGTRKAMIVFAVWYAVALAINATNNIYLVYLSIFMIGMSIGGSANFTTSLPVSIFGRQNFSDVNSVIFPIQGIVSSFSFLINGIVLNATGGSLRYSYLILACVSLLAGMIVWFVDEYKYNADHKVEVKYEKEEGIID